MARDARPKPNEPSLDTFSSEPEGERTLFKHVPSELLERAAHPSQIPLAGPEDPDDRTAIFAPPSELLSELREQLALMEAEQRITPVAPTPRFSESPKSQPPKSQAPRSQAPRTLLAPGSLGSRSAAPGPRGHRIRTALVASLVVLFLAATGYAYLRSGRGLSFPPAATKTR